MSSQGQLASQLGLASTEVRLDAHGRVSLARGPLGALGADPLAFVRDRTAALGLMAGEGLVLLQNERAAVGTQHLRIGRAIGGIPVAFDQIRVHAGSDGAVYALEAETSPLETYAYRPPAFPPAEAVRRAAGGFQGKLASAPTTGLVIVGERLEGVKGAHLAYRVELAYPQRDGEVPRAEAVYLDARSGAVLGRLSLVMTDSTTVSGADLDDQSVTLQASRDADGTSIVDSVTVPGVTFALLNGGNGGALYTSDTIIGDKAAFSAGKNVAQVLALFADPAGLAFNRWDFNRSPVGTGGTVIAVPHTGTNLGNAFFSIMTTSTGTKYGVMSFGDGDGETFRELERCLDVAGHEMGHGIVSATANLVYHSQSGALNESFADVFGWLSDQANTQIAEGCLTAAHAGQGLRDMCDPSNTSLAANPQPASMDEYQNLPDTSEGDHGGVHTNSGIPNHAACLYKQGASFSDLRRVWYQALSVHLGPTSDFRAMVEATMTSCSELGLGSCAALGSAWTEVGLAPAGNGSSCPPNATMQNGQCFCDAGYHVNSAGTGCDADAATSCPDHAHAVGTDCYCDTGYTPDTAGASCVLVSSESACGPHSHVEGANCVCDTCYQPDQIESSTCVLVPGCAICSDPLSYSDGSGSCACIPGTVFSGDACTPVSGTCGAENFTGRCVGDRLIYCDNTQSPIQIRSVDCSQNPTATTCAFAENGFDCRAPPTACGSVPDTGVCVGTDAQICSSGALQSYDCTGSACRAFTYGGVPVHFCYPCPDHATWTDAANGAGTCGCDSGYQENADHTACIHSSSGGGGGGSGSGGGGGGGMAAQNGGGGGGCSIGEGGSSTGDCLLPVLGLLALLRRISARPSRFSAGPRRASQGKKWPVATTLPWA